MDDDGCHSRVPLVCLQQPPPRGRGRVAHHQVNRPGEGELGAGREDVPRQPEGGGGRVARAGSAPGGGVGEGGSGSGGKGGRADLRDRDRLPARHPAGGEVGGGDHHSVPVVRLDRQLAAVAQGRDVDDEAGGLEGGAVAGRAAGALFHVIAEGQDIGVCRSPRAAVGGAAAHGAIEDIAVVAADGRVVLGGRDGLGHSRHSRDRGLVAVDSLAVRVHLAGAHVAEAEGD
mmetsp:Transcript_1956/g.3135  ORF Transcript_1956/g.3135 Transcript_1956/m.3135 type:complete len:230 (-) Transcript_1956:217-906(-)